MIILIGIAVAILYFGLLYAAPGPDKTVAEPALAPGEPRVFRNLGLGVLAFFLLDAVIFHSGLYTAILKPKSHAGAAATHLRAEKQRSRWADKEILVMGDSRVALGFSNDMANEMAQGKNVAFIERAVFGSKPRIWHYFLREIDPARNRYQMIVLPLKPEDRQVSRRSDDHPSEIVQMAPYLRYSDARSFASSFHEWPNQARAFTACILRGTAYQSDLFDLLEHPAERIRDLRRGIVETDPAPDRKIRNRDLTGLVFNPTTRRIEKYPEHLSEIERKRLWRSFKQLSRERRLGGNDYAWSKRIVERYASSPTTIVFARLPRGPLASFLSPDELPERNQDEEWLSSHAVVLDYRTFEFLETPEYFLDYTHLNQKGQRMFTKRLTEELLARLHINSADGAQAGLPDTLSE